MKKIKDNNHTWIIPLYGLFYMISFVYLEQRMVEYNIIHCTLDDYIPFCEYFVVPYVLWYVFVAATFWYFAFWCRNRDEYWQLVWVSIIGMTAFLIISFVCPNGQELRPVLQEGNLFVQIVKLIYRIDPPTNILPSMHVFNAVSCCTAICRNQDCKKHRWIIRGTQVLTVLIVLSTMFLKQHTVIDVVLAFILYGLCYRMVYVTIPQHRQKNAEHPASIKRKVTDYYA